MDSKITNFLQMCRQNTIVIERLIATYYKTRPINFSFLDGGSSMGHHTFQAAKHFKGKILAVEANENTYKRFVVKLSEKSFEVENRIIPVYGALQEDSKKETVSFYCSSSHPGRSSMNVKLWEDLGKGKVIYKGNQKVPALTIDGLSAKYQVGDIGFIKLDLESGEFSALKGAKNVLKKNRPHIAMEYAIKLNNQHIMGYSQDDIFKFITNQGYVLLSPWGEELKANQSFCFSYAFVIPIENVNESKSCLEKIFQSRSWYSGY
jgi:FkbM family methyltransferase